MSYVGFNPKFNTVRYVPQSADPTNPTEGQVFRSDGTVRAKGLWEYRDGSWKSVGTGAGSPDTICLIDADNYGSTAAFATGDGTITAGAELPGGTLQGTFSLQTGSVVEGVNSWRYIQAAGSLDSYIFSDVQTIDPAFRGKDVGVNIIAKYDGADNDILFIVWDETNNQILTQTDFYVKYSTVFKNYQTVFTIPSTCTQVRIGFQVKVLNSGKQLDWDMMSIFDRPFVMASTQDTQYLNYTAAQNTYQDLTAGDHRLPTGLTTSSFSGSGILRIEDDGAGTRTKIVALRSCLVNINYSAAVTTSGNFLSLYKNGSGTAFARSSATSAANEMTEVVGAIGLSAGDYFTLASSANLENAATVMYLGITATAQVESVITPASNSLVYSARILNTGTASIEVQGPQDWIASVTRPSIGRVAITFTSNFFTVEPIMNVTITDSGGYIMGCESGSSSGVTVTCYNDLGALTDKGFDIIVTRSGNDAKSASRALVATPVERTAYLKHVATSGTGGGTATATTNNFQIGTTANFVWSGDTSFIRQDTATNSWYMPPGTYELIHDHCFYGVDNASAHVRNATDSTSHAKTPAFESPSGSPRAGSTGQGVELITITSEKQFNWRYTIDTTRASDGLGNPNGDGTTEHFGTLRIKKIK